MRDAPPQIRPLPAAPAQIGVVLLIAAALWLVYGPGFVGIDAMWSIVWGRDLVHLAPLAESGTTTPHVLSNALGALLTPLGADADRGLIAIEYLGAATLVWVVALTAREAAGWPGAVLAGVLIAGREQLLYATRGGFLDVLAAALVSVAVLLLVRGRLEGLRGAAVLLGLAGLLRPEPWVLLGLLALLGWRRAGRLDPLVAGLVIAVPALWAISDLVLSGDALFSLNETRRVSALFRAGQGIPTGLREQVISIPRTIGRAAGPEVVLLAIPLVALLWPGARWSGLRARLLGEPAPEVVLALRTMVGVAVLLAAVIAAEGLTGTLLFSRFSLQVAAPLCAAIGAVLAMAAATLAPQRAVPLVAAGALGLLLISAPLLLSARRTTDPEHARYAAARALLRGGVPCDPLVVPGVSFRAFAAAWTGQRGDDVVASAEAPVPPATGTFVDAVGTDERAALLDPSFPQRSAPPEVPQVRRSGGWVLRATCPAADSAGQR